MFLSTGALFEDVLFDNKREIVEKVSSSALEHITALYNKGELIAERIITKTGVEFFIAESEGEVNPRQNPVNSKIPG